MIHTNQWSPDTCRCVIEFTWDDEEPQETRTHSFSRCIRVCPAHGGLSGASVFTALLDQNRRKNRSRAMFLEELRDIVTTTDPESGAIIFKPGIEMSWSWQGENADRVLYVMLEGVALNPAQINRVQDRLDALFGAGKVVVQ